MTFRVGRAAAILLVAFFLTAPTMYAYIPPDIRIDPQPPGGTGEGGCPNIIMGDCVNGVAVNCYLTGATLDLYGNPVCHYNCKAVRCLLT